MGLTDSKKDNQVKSVKSCRFRFGNIKDFHGRRQTTESHKSFNIEPDVVKETTKKPNPIPVSLFGSLSRPIFPPQSPNSFSLFGSKMEHSLRDELRPIRNTEPEINQDPKPTQSFQQHMAKWKEDFHKPFTVISQNSEFEMPYCYSTEFFNQERVKHVAKFDFGIGSQLAVPQDYRHRPLQMILVKSSVAQFIADACDLNNAKLYFDRFVDDGIRFEMSHPVFFQEKNETAIYLVADYEPNQDCKDVQSRNDCAIYTSSWQN